MKTCQHNSQCLRDATWGLYRFTGAAAVNTDLSSLVRSFCGQHKPRLDRGEMLRNVKLARA